MRQPVYEDGVATSSRPGDATALGSVVSAEDVLAITWLTLLVLGIVLAFRWGRGRDRHR